MFEVGNSIFIIELGGQVGGRRWNLLKKVSLPTNILR